MNEGKKSRSLARTILRWAALVLTLLLTSAVTVAVGFVAWWYSSIKGGFDTRVALRPWPWATLTVAGFLLMVVGPAIWLFGVPTYWAWKRQAPRFWRFTITLFLAAALVLALWYSVRYLHWAIF